MALKSYVVTQDFKTPYVRMTGVPHKPQEIRFKKFKKGEVVNGELKHANNKPAFILVGGVCVVPLEVVKEIVTKDVVSNASGDSKSIDNVVKNAVKTNNPKIHYLDAIILGGLAGVGGVYLAEKKGWLVSPDNKNKIYGAIGGALVGLYLVYRSKNK